MYKVVTVKFRSKDEEGTLYNSKDYLYYTTEDVKVGDFAVVEVHKSAMYGGGLKVVKVFNVQEVGNCAGLTDLKWLVVVIDFEAYKKRLEEENRINNIRYQLSEEVKTARQRLDMEQLKQYNPNIETLMRELDQLTGRSASTDEATAQLNTDQNLENPSS